MGDTRDSRCGRTSQGRCRPPVHDFQAVLEAFAKSKVPMPGSGRWAGAGMVRGGSADIAWVVYNAQYFGTAQRRRRVFLVADLGGGRSGEVLFVPKSLRRYFEEGGTPRQGAAAFAESGAGGAGRGAGAVPVNCIAGNIIGRREHNGGNGLGFQEGVPYTLTAMDCHAVSAPAVTMRIRSGCDGGGKGPLLQIEKSGTLATGNDQYLFEPGPVTAGINGSATVPLVSGCYKGTGERWGSGRDAVLCTATGQGHAEIQQGLAPTLNCVHEQPYITCPERLGSHAGYKVRRLMPLECERLQGFPDHWTAQGHDGRQVSDSKRYRMLGNSIAVPCAAYIMQALGGSEEPSMQGLYEN